MSQALSSQAIDTIKQASVVAMVAYVSIQVLYGMAMPAPMVAYIPAAPVAVAVAPFPVEETSRVQTAAIINATKGGGSSVNYDINRDGVVDVLDVELEAEMIQSALENPEKPVQQLRLYDLNGDSVLDLWDWRMMHEYVYIDMDRMDILFDVDAGGDVDVLDVHNVAEMLDGIAANDDYRVRYDLNADGVNSLWDWRMMHEYVYIDMDRMDILFDVDADGDVDVFDVHNFAEMLDGIIAHDDYRTRYDLNADGVNSLWDWRMMHEYVYIEMGRMDMLFDVDTDGDVDMFDVHNFAEMLDAIVAHDDYRTRYDLNADGVNSLWDWQFMHEYIYIEMDRMDILFDVDTDGDVDGFDVANFAEMLDDIVANDDYRTRYDLNADGVNSLWDWQFMHEYVYVVLDRMDILLDVDTDGDVDGADAAAVEDAVNSGEYRTRYDLSVDGVLDANDVTFIAEYLD